MIEVELYETQLSFLDEMRSARGTTREEALRLVLLEHRADRQAGAGAHIGGAVRDDVMQARLPAYGAMRHRQTLEPITGCALPLHEGDLLRIEQLVGGQCVDFNAFNLHDYKEFLDCGFTRSFQSFQPRAGDFIWTNAPRGRPMFAILEMAPTCEVDLVGHRCNRIFMELGWDTPDHANCQDTLAEAIRQYGLTPDDVHDSFNLWMSTTVDETGRRQYNWNPARRGDRVELLALFDVLAVVCICGNGDLLGLNNYTFAPVGVDVFEATSESRALASQVNEKWGRLGSQTTTADLTSTPVRRERELAVEPSYVPQFRPAPTTHHVSVVLTPEEKAVALELRSSGVYGDTLAEVVRAAFMRWCNTHQTPTRRAKLELVKH
jgi:uncharacterized protein